MPRWFVCSAEGCEQRRKTTGRSLYCPDHEQRWSVKGYRKLPLYDRVMLRVTVDDSGCWLFTGAKAHNGYGKIGYENREIYVHRITYEHHKGEIPAGYQVDHLCRVRNCVNPEHLEAVTRLENIRRSEAPNVVAARSGICKRGHSLADAYVTSTTGLRTCRPCALERGRAKRARWVDLATDEAAADLDSLIARLKGEGDVA